MIVTHEGNPATPEGISHIDALRDSAFDAIKATPLSDCQDLRRRHGLDLQGHPRGVDLRPDDRRYRRDRLILLIMMFITRSLVAAVVIVGTVVLSLGASLGLSVLVWQYIFGIELYWIVIRTGDHPSAGGGCGLQPAADIGSRRRSARD